MYVIISFIDGHLDNFSFFTMTNNSAENIIHIIRYLREILLLSKVWNKLKNKIKYRNRDKMFS